MLGWELKFIKKDTIVSVSINIELVKILYRIAWWKISEALLSSLSDNKTKPNLPLIRGSKDEEIAITSARSPKLSFEYISEKYGIEITNKSWVKIEPNNNIEKLVRFL